ncbi:Rha family transcriptional regulator [Psychrobacter sp. I-STPA10]|uniref:Rha family transcriptional regulator n=1 Tax=Psychrobacter sp. I-STPA10 TaxID=2585769 RepID=UPI001E3B0EB3|nr:Rha family transcriptional regulator [Psychrobacter sp. I-STPA10]
MNAMALTYQQLVQTHDNQVITTSKIIADTFGKLHKDVLRKIEHLSAEIQKTWYKTNFRLIQIEVDLGQNRTRLDKGYELTKDGFMLLVMGFTGKKAMALKIEFINAFNWMYDQLQRTDSKQRECLISACDKLAVGNTLRSEVYTMVANHFGYERVTQIPTPLLPEAVAFVYDVILARQKGSTNQDYQNSLRLLGLSKVEDINHAVGVAKKQLCQFEHVLKALDCAIEVIHTHNHTNGSVFKNLENELIGNNK